MRVDCEHIKKVLSDKASAIASAIMGGIAEDAGLQSHAINERYKVMLVKISEEPKNEAELAKLKYFISECQKNIKLVCFFLSLRSAMDHTF